MLRESQHEPAAEGPAKDATPTEAAAVPGNRAFGALARRGDRRALARAIAAQRLGNRATQALIAREDWGLGGSTYELHKQVYGDPELAHAPSPQPQYEFSEVDGPVEPDKGVVVKPGPVRVDLIKPKGPDLTPHKAWLRNALEQDKLLKALPDWARDKAIGALEDIDETVAEKIIDALPWDAKVKGAATAALKGLLKTAKGKKFEIPPAPPATRAPDWSKQPDFQPSPGQVIIPGPVIKW